MTGRTYESDDVSVTVSVTGNMYRSDDITSGLTNKGFCDREDVWK